MSLTKKTQRERTVEERFGLPLPEVLRLVCRQFDTQVQAAARLEITPITFRAWLLKHQISWDVEQAKRVLERCAS